MEKESINIQDALYDFFGLTENEIEIVEKTMRPLVLEKDDIGKEFYETYRHK